MILILVIKCVFYSCKFRRKKKSLTFTRKFTKVVCGRQNDWKWASARILSFLVALRLYIYENVQLLI